VCRFGLFHNFRVGQVSYPRNWGMIGSNCRRCFFTHIQLNFVIVIYSVGYENVKLNQCHFQDMLAEVLEWGLKPTFGTGDSWYSCAGNLKMVRNHHMGFLFAVESNRRVSFEKGKWTQVQHLEVPDDGLLVWLHDFGEVKLFRTWLKDQSRHYVVYLPDVGQLATYGRDAFNRQHYQHWQIEQYHRAIKQVCHILIVPDYGVGLNVAFD